MQPTEIAMPALGTPDAYPTVMMFKVLPLTALALGLLGGVAQADHGRGGDRRGRFVERHAAPHHTAVRDHHGWRGGGRGVVVRDVRDHRDGNRGGRTIIRGERHHPHHIVRQPIYVSRPVIRERYYNYYRRPAVIIESYNPMAGYYWVAGRWAWNGYEWIWQPGHYEPDPSYVYQGY
jgi:hypothetical protein